MVKQSLQQSLQQKLSPQQIQLMKLIELSTLELEQKVKDEIETNPALDDDLSSEAIEKDDIDLLEDSTDSLENDFDLDQYISDDEVPEYKMYSNNFSEDDQESKIPIVGGHTHLDLLKSQLNEVKLVEKEQKIAEYIIGCVDDDGYIRRTVEEIIDDLVFKENLICETSEIKKILFIVQDFDPPGIAARDLQECLLLQLKRKEPT
jgi:RNA polymerase sigma-54 factor